MSRLESFIRRLQAQRACLDLVMPDLVPGLVIELGLGNGRTYDHLLEHLPGRRIIVFERQPNPQAMPMPADADLIRGQLAETLPIAAEQWANSVALIHSDIGCGDAAIDASTAALVGRHATRLLAPGGCLVSDQSVSVQGLSPQALPAEIQPGRYYIYRKALAT
ncbi:S-adenosyl-L-methionine methyltransferase [Arboricoccus pini]|uniref:S-adenosyl-L-methionine methyltransferase n=1 Tax=Arboricoccus pini TaxID=1963835 RepID=A0A212Q1E8_9PROT|nr:class I SAM-dependent methyltransferase [Arboricoccus pini]SNB53132.1 S-adenosyl-L-methionine methyltransferase [Arboricoccus pini]